MTRYAKVENGKVVQTQPNDEVGFILVPESLEDVVCYGWSFGQGGFVEPEAVIYPPSPPVPGLIGSAGFTIADGAVTTVELAAQLAGAYYEQGYVQVYFTETQTLPYLVFVQTDVPCKVEQYKESGALELVFSDPLTGNPIDLGRIDLQILNVR